MTYIFLVCIVVFVGALFGLIITFFLKILAKIIMIENYISSIKVTIFLMQDQHEYIDNSLIAINEKLGLEDKDLGTKGLESILKSVEDAGE